MLQPFVKQSYVDVIKNTHQKGLHIINFATCSTLILVHNNKLNKKENTSFYTIVNLSHHFTLVLSSSLYGKKKKKKEMYFNHKVKKYDIECERSFSTQLKEKKTSKNGGNDNCNRCLAGRCHARFFAAGLSAAAS